MTEAQNKTVLASVFSSVLALTFYGRIGRDALLALVLCGVLLIFLGGLTYFLRAWLSASWVRVLMLVFAAAAAQAAWSKQGLEPWWVLAAMGLLLPAAGSLRNPLKLLEFSAQAVILEAAGLCFFALRSALELTASRFFWEQPAGHLSLLGLMALVVGLLETRGEKHGS
jgi:hypothetical protein